MKKNLLSFLFPILFLCCVGSISFAQTPPVMPPPIIPPQPPVVALPLITQYLSLTSTQVQAVVQNNNSFNQFASTKLSRIFQVQTEIAQVTQASPIDPMALGMRYGEIEEICRELRSNAAQFQQKNRDALTDAQKTKLQALQDAMNLLPVIFEGQSDNLLSSPGTPVFFNTFSSILLGQLTPSVAPGCTPPGATVGGIRIGDFTPGPTVKPKN